MEKRVKGSQEAHINRFKIRSSEQSATEISLESDPIGVEEPLQITLNHQGLSRVFSLTMRTPGDDRELVYGLLFSEGVIRQVDDIVELNQQQYEGMRQENLYEVVLRENLSVELPHIERRLTSYSGCGLCGKTNLQALELKQSRPMKSANLKLSPETVSRLKALLNQQPLFSKTGGVHAAGLVCDTGGKLDFERTVFFEDVGRHNALDKLIGHELLYHDLQRSGVLVLSGRIGFELVQKAVIAGFSVIVALGAPSSLAVQAANQFNIALIGFAKARSFNLYTSHQALLE